MSQSNYTDLYQANIIVNNLIKEMEEIYKDELVKLNLTNPESIVALLEKDWGNYFIFIKLLLSKITYFIAYGGELTQEEANKLKEVEDFISAVRLSMPTRAGGKNKRNKTHKRDKRYKSYKRNKSYKRK